MMIVGILPTLGEQHLHARALSANPRYTAAQRADLRRPRRGPADLDRRRRAALRVRRLDRARGRVHERPAAPARPSRGLRAPLERGAGDRRRAARGRRELAVLLRQGAVARDADRAVRAGDRHAAGGAQGAGRAPARVVRRALDHVDLRPVRGERPLLPGAAAAVRRRGSASRCSSAATRRRSASSSSTTAPSTAGTGRSTRSCAGARTCAWRTACCRPGPTVVDMLANAAFYYGLVRALVESERPIWSQMSFSARRGQPPRGRPRRPRRARLLAGRRRRAGDRAGAAPAAPARPRGARALRRRPARARPAARDHRAPLRGGGQRRDLAEPARSGGSTRRRASTASRRCARMTVRYREHMHGNEPVHTWPVELVPPWPPWPPWPPPWRRRRRDRVGVGRGAAVPQLRRRRCATSAGPPRRALQRDARVGAARAREPERGRRRAVEPRRVRCARQR